MFNRAFFEGLQDRLKSYFNRFPAAESAAVVIVTPEAEFILVDIIDTDDKFITFAFWPRDNADIPKSWDDVRDSLEAVTIPYPDIRSVHFNPKLARNSEIGFTKSGRKLGPAA